MRRTGTTEAATIALLVLLLGAPGLLWAHCAACQAMAAPRISGCHSHGENGPQLRAEYCCGKASLPAPSRCCGRLEAPAPLSATMATAAPAASSLAPAPPATIPPVLHRQEPANPLRLADHPSHREGTGLFLLLSVFRI